MNRITLANDLIQKKGRGNVKLGSFPMFQNGSGIEFNIKASELYLEYEADYNTFEPWFSVLINGVRYSRQMAQKGIHKICLFHGMNSNTIKRIRITKDVQSMPEDSRHFMVIHAIETDGVLTSYINKKNKIEFIGDSITSGEGLIGAQSDEDWVSLCFDSVNHYANLTADQLDADYRIVSQSGWGVYTAWDNNIKNVIPSIYETVCGTNNSEKGIYYGSKEKNKFNDWQPDIIVVNLGTNDGGAFRNPSWLDPETGIEYKLHSMQDDTRNTEDLKKVENSIVQFLRMLRRNNAKAHIIWAYGILGNEIGDSIQTALEQYRSDTGDTMIELLIFPYMNEEQTGARQHPGIGAHKMMCECLLNRIKELFIPE